MLDCIDAQITSDLKESLERITIANGYNTDIGTVEEKRSEFRVEANSPYTMIEKLSPDIDEDYQHTEDGTIKYMFYYFNGKDDTREDTEPIQYEDRNVIADIQKAIMCDRTRNNVAQNTYVKSHGHDYYYQQGEVDILIMCTWVLVYVERMINADDPYELA